MLRGLIISPDVEAADYLSRVLTEMRVVSIARFLDHYPDAGEVGRVLRATAPQVVFVSAESMPKVLEVIRDIEVVAPGIQFVAISRKCDPDVLLEAMRVGVREFLSAPFAKEAVHEALTRVNETLQRRPAQINTTDAIFSFLPSKAGVGASTLALNTGVAFSKLPGTNCVLSDFDMNSGMMRFMLKLTNEYSVADACEHSGNMDESLWPQIVTKLGNLDVLHAGKLNPNVRIEGAQIRHLIDFLRRNYKALVFDLSGNLEKYSLEIMHESKQIFLVCTPEIPSLHLAREKFAFLKSMDLENRVSVLVNRCQKRQVITNEQIEQILGLPVQMVFPNDYPGVHKALTLGRWIDFESELGKHISHFATTLMGDRVKGSGKFPKMTQKNKLLDFFSTASFGGAKAS